MHFCIKKIKNKKYLWDNLGLHLGGHSLSRFLEVPFDLQTSAVFELLRRLAAAVNQ